jgi:hypothetical protein
MWLKFLSIAIMATAPAPAHKNCHRCTNPCPPAATAPAAVVAPASVKHEPDWKSGFEVVAGFRWDREIECPTQPGTSSQSISHQSDPFYLGIQERLPLNEYLTLQGRLDRDLYDHGDFLEESHWTGSQH